MSSIDESALDKAQEGRYPACTADQIHETRLSRWFTPTANGYRVSETLRSRDIVAAQSVIADPPFRGWIWCLVATC